MIEVSAALIWNEDKFMICQRPANKARGLLWEFPGGKLETGETIQECLIRECREELGVTISTGTIFKDLVHNYPDIKVHLTLINASIVDGNIQRIEHEDIRWITKEEIDDYIFCPADHDFLEALKGK